MRCSYSIINYEIWTRPRKIWTRHQTEFRALQKSAVGTILKI